MQMLAPSSVSYWTSNWKAETFWKNTTGSVYAIASVMRANDANPFQHETIQMMRKRSEYSDTIKDNRAGTNRAWRQLQRKRELVGGHDRVGRGRHKVCRHAAEIGRRGHDMGAKHAAHQRADGAGVHGNEARWRLGRIRVLKRASGD